MQTAYAFPNYTRWERRIDVWLHVLGLGLTVIGGTLLLSFAQPGAWFPLLLYVLGMVATYVASTVYHAVPAGPAKEVFRRLDHAMIFVMIAGSYAPYALISLWGRGGLWLGIAIWSAALIGVAIKLFFPRRWEWLGLALYIGMGWGIVAAIGPLMETVSATALLLLLIGGILYTLGTVFHSLERMPFHNVAWHALVLGGAATHFAAAAVQFTV